MADERPLPTRLSRQRDLAAAAVLLGVALLLGVRVWQAKARAHAMTPDEIGATYDKACALFAVGQYEMAREGLLKVAETTPDRTLAMRCTMKAADCLFYDETKPARERLLQAKAAYEKVIGDYPGVPEVVWAQFQVGNILQALELHEEAVAAYKALVVRHADQPHAAAAHLKIGLCLLARGKHEEARKELEDLVKRHPDSPEAAQAAFAIPKTYAPPPAKKAENATESPDKSPKETPEESP